MARFKTAQDVQQFIQELSKTQENGHVTIDLAGLYQARLECYKQIESLRNNRLLVYFSNFLNSAPGAIIDLHDVLGFTDLISTTPDNIESVDILIHSGGGMPDATERIVGLLRQRFKTVNFLIPHSAYSAATMLALSGNEIILHQSATLGPIDPQINGSAAKSIKRGFDNAIDKIKQLGPNAIAAYVPLLEKYTLQLLELCDDAEKLSQDLVSEWLQKYMCSNKPEIKDISKIVHFFSDFDNHHTHSRPITIDKINDFNLNIRHAEPELNELLWEAFLLLVAWFDIMKNIKNFLVNYMKILRDLLMVDRRYG
jgi:hypothetical protein